jgi:hypothetical protein
MLVDSSAARERGADGDRLVATLFASTAFYGSFLVFLLEPIIAKLLLPWFGGAANVWATCLVFFQVVLVLGYGYADVSARLLDERRLALVFAMLAFAAGLALPVVPAAHWKPDGAAGPVPLVLGALTTTIGLPFLVLAAAGPQQQKWHALRLPDRSPYRLFALSNLASLLALLALLAYPFAFEPWLGTHARARLWSIAYVVWALLLLLSALCARTVRRRHAGHLADQYGRLARNAGGSRPVRGLGRSSGVGRVHPRRCDESRDP